MTYVILAALAVVVFIGLYWFVHHKLGFTALGRISATVIPVAGILIDQFTTLPWPQLLDAGKAVAVTSGLLIGHCLVQAYNMIVQSLNSPAAPPAPTPPAA